MEGLATLNFLGLVVGAIAVIYYQRKLSATKVASETINLLQSQVNAQDLVLKNNQEEIKNLTLQGNTFKTQLEEKDKTIAMYLSIFQGRDGKTVEFQTKGFETMEKFNKLLPIIAETHKSSLANQKSMITINKNVERLYALMEKHLQSIENTAITK